jgi:hypothetical protein
MLTLFQFEICNRLHSFRNENGKDSIEILTGDEKQIENHSKALAQCTLYINDKYLQHCRREIPLQRTAQTIGKIILSKAALIIHYPLLRSQRNLGNVSKSMIDKLYDASCDIIEPGHGLMTDSETYAYTWHYQTYVHWHPVAFLLREFCTLQMTQEQMTRAWRAITWAITDPHGLEPESNRALWKPLDGLIDRAKAKILALDTGIDAGSISPWNQSSTELGTNTGFEIPFEEMQDWLAPVDDNLIPLDLNTPLVPYLPTDSLNGGTFGFQYGF